MPWEKVFTFCGSPIQCLLRYWISPKVAPRRLGNNMFVNFFLLAVIFLLTSCTDVGERDNPDDPDGINYQRGGSGVIPGPSVFYGENYETVVIGEQTWFKRNLNYAVTGSKCGNGSGLSDANTTTCDTYGRLYDWETAMKLPGCNSKSCSSQIDTKHHQGICPDGWHIPSNADWDKLMRYVDGNTGTSSPYDSPTAGKYLKSASGWNSGGNGTDKYGFSALPGGYGDSDGSFYGVGSIGYWWSASENLSSGAYLRGMGYSSEIAGYSSYGKSYLQSVRCLQD